MENTALVFLPVFINRLTEAFKRAVLVKWELPDETQTFIVLGASLVLGVLGVVFVFPSTNLIPGQGASALAEQIVTGVVIGGLANGIDFLGGKLDAVFSSKPKAA